MIGVIGGNGVAATNKLMQLVEERCTKAGAFRDAHHPEMIVWQATQVPSRSLFLEGRGESFIPGYVSIGRGLKACGCTRLCMCCNTAHYAIDDLEQQIGLPFINMLQLVAQRVASTGGTKVGIMCSDGLSRYRLYDEYIHKEVPSMEIVYPDAETQNMVTQGICNAKSKIRFDTSSDKNPQRLFDEVCRRLASEGCDVIVAGCTDIRNVFYLNTPGYVDSLSVLADAICDIFNREHDI
ncbi:MAG: amino acid racemase [Bacteroidales bacterium]|nr:amino acid racemase [Bacteroidales bacterium]